MERPWRKRIRLPAPAYLEAGRVWHVTIGTASRGAVFADHVLARAVVGAIVERCAARGAGLPVYCLMPDHLHLLVQVGDTGLVEVVGDVKSRTTRVWWAHGGAGVVWQRSFYDRGIRTMTEFDETVRYIVENPVRAGLVEDWRAYPFVGGALVEEGM
jgi:REP element-mobilizing transposase RayT